VVNRKYSKTQFVRRIQSLFLCEQAVYIIVNILYTVYELMNTCSRRHRLLVFIFLNFTYYASFSDMSFAKGDSFGSTYIN